MEKLAALEHDRWASWQRHMHSKGSHDIEGRLCIDSQLFQHWERQINTPYEQLTEREKEMDRVEVRKYLKLIQGGSRG